MGRLVAALALGLCLTAFAVPVAAGVRAFRTSDGSEDPAFVRLGARTRVDRVVADGSLGAYLIGRIIVNGGARQIVHLRRDGTVDRAFRPSIRGGSVAEAAVHGDELALIGTFRSIDGHARSRVAMVDAHTAARSLGSRDCPDRRTSTASVRSRSRAGRSSSARTAASWPGDGARPRPPGRGTSNSP